jgi:hypothetical protein
MKALIIPALLVTGCAPALAQQRPASPGVAITERVPTDIRRTTIIVRDMEKSLALYRDVLGMKVNYDTVVQTSGVALPAGVPGAKARLVPMTGGSAGSG